MNEFEKALFSRCKEDPQYEVLWAQWTYDKRLVTQALQAVGVLFPHYSLHDASHSNTILRQLARVLGPRRIERLSPTDLWLLLEAAYLHDIGMVVSDAQKRQWWHEAAFHAHLERLKESSDRDLRNAAGVLSSKEKIDSLGEEWPFEVQHALLIVMADYARQQHPRMAEQIILDPTLVGLASPRVLIPRRVFQLLSLICRHHGSSFEKALDLPPRESGYGTDEAHPRFVACMLRLGDLLDLDDGRFCPVLMRSLKGLPPSSLAHERKHASIRHLLVSPTRIEVEAVCAKDDLAAFDETERWLSWLRDELRNQAAKWADIVPDEDFGALPSAGRITARIEGHITLDDGSLPRFEVDREAMINMVRGANIYDHPVSFLRELLQNAVDATLLRCWNEHRQEFLEWEKNKTKRDEVLELLRQKLEGYPIRVHIDQSGPTPTHADALSGGKCRFKVVIEDQGLGISRGDIRYMQSIGGTRNNQRKQQRRAKMPDWMQPSGIFGIGLQSVFLFTDRLDITTRPDDAKECLKITLRRGEEGSVGQIIVQELHGAAAWGRPGSKLECEIEVPLLPKSVKGPHWVFDEFFSDFDGVKGTTVPYELVLARTEISEFAEGSLCPIELEGVRLGNSANETHSAKDADTSSDNIDPDRWLHRYFDRETNIELALRSQIPDMYFGLFDDADKVFYRGVHAGGVALSLEGLVTLRADLHFGRADEFLTLSREQIRSDKVETVKAAIKKALHRVFPRYYNAIRSPQGASSVSPHEIQAASLFAETEGHNCEPPQKSYGEWRNSKLPRMMRKNLTLGDVVSARVIELVTGGLAGFPARKIAPKKQKEVDLRLVLRDVPGWLWSLLLRTHKPVYIGKASAYYYHDNDPVSVYRFYLDHTQVAAPLAGTHALRSVLREVMSRSYGVVRSTMPIAPGFEKLQINKEPSYVNELVPRLFPRMICPFGVMKDRVTVPNVMDVVNWTVRHAQDKQVLELSESNPTLARSLVAGELLRFIERADQLMKGDKWAKARAYDIDEVRVELRKEFGLE